MAKICIEASGLGMRARAVPDQRGVHSALAAPPLCTIMSSGGRILRDFPSVVTCRHNNYYYYIICTYTYTYTYL